MAPLKLQPIHISLAFDNFYKVHIYAMLASIFFNNRENTIVIHAILPGVSENERSDIVAFVHSNDSEIRFYDLDETILREYIQLADDSYFTITTFFKWFFPSLVQPGIEKILYLDPDIIVIKSLLPLYNLDTGDHPIAAVTDAVVGKREDLGITEEGNYFNAGVLLIDIEKWKNQNVTENALKFVKSYDGNLVYLDQDALNATLKNNWLRIDKVYNFTSADVKLQIPVKELVRDTVIVHFTSYHKPWHALTRNKLRYLYHYYLKMTPQASRAKYTDFKWDVKNIWVFLRIRMKEFYFNHKIDTILPIKKWMAPSLDY